MFIRKMSALFGCTRTVELDEKGKWPCYMCKKGVGNDLVLCISCWKCFHKQRSSI